MATRQQQRGGNPPSRPPASVRTVYEVFKPISERQEDKESHFLHVNLPGFLREQIKVSTESPKVLRVRGERLVAGNKWSRFQEDFDIPEDSNLDGIRAKFEGGILTITMPKKITTQLDSKTKTIQETPLPLDSAGGPKSRKVEEDIQPKSQKSDQEAKNIIERESKESIKGGNVVKEIVEKGMGKKDENVGSYQEKAKDRSRGENGKETKAPENILEIAMERERKSREESKESKKAENIVNKEVVGKGREKRDGNVASKQEKGKDHTTSREKGKEKTEMTYGSYKVEGLLAKELNEERELMVNMGVAVLVIVALGAYIFNNFGSL